MTSADTRTSVDSVALDGLCRELLESVIPGLEKMYADDPYQLWAKRKANRLIFLVDELAT